MNSHPYVQGKLFGDTAGPTRPTDPETSAEAAALPGRRALRLRVLDGLVLWGPISDEALAEQLGESGRKDSVAKRRQELVEAGLAYHPCDMNDLPLHGRSRRGARVRLWGATIAGVQASVNP